ncbi:hypothetical protein CC77DRAFT_1065094 [Alternaria alternata]|uniref:Uncharacterized protein n=2 Tax=Alternaria alternata complex TaxID=187734 RepID=A0A177DBX9_ALTAL|nr:hypothetical protein CC77DRAFT_1065094 [Alternaria alternata]KAH6840494.1 hypothetical protein B0T12DRAFT_489809 [Alternaria alternata]OAG16650.1 hypothetical protein CC77DRAFT_1065094 [Alternaria alternata]RYN42950.1 hypothetical protein AA0114_g10323 [Alternaria tenuissima]
MKAIFRVAHILLVLSLSSLLIYSVYYAFALLRQDQQQLSKLSHPQAVSDEGGAGEVTDDDVLRKPSPQEIAHSMNTMWDYLDDWDEDHCINVCEASWIACQLRNCGHLPYVRQQEL